MSRLPVLFVSIGLAVLASSGMAGAQELTLGQADATYPRLVDTSHIDPNTFVMGHPSSVHTHSGHAGFQHPAVTQQAAAAEIDANTFIPRHPAGAATASTDAAPAVSAVSANR